MATIPGTVPIVGRDRELALLQSAIGRARGHRGGAVILEGDAGIGKTRLARELRRRAMEAGFVVGAGACHESDWSPPFGLWSLVAGEIGREALDAQPDARRQVLLEIMRELRPMGPVEHAPTLSAEEARFRATDAVARLLLDVADKQPLLVILDDLQWVDQASLDVLTYMARFIANAPLLVLGTYRPGEVNLDHPLARSLGELDRQGVCSRVCLGSLSDRDALGLVECLAGTISSTLAARIVAEAKGHPFFITEVVRHLLDEGHDLSVSIDYGVPQGIRHAVATRIARLAAQTRHLLAVAAAFTRPFEFSVLVVMMELGEEALLAVFDEALRAQLVRAVGAEKYEFSHDLIRRTLYDAIGPSRRARLHRRIAQALERVHEGREVEHAGELAAQYHASASLPGAEHGIRYAVAAAEQARRAHAAAQAVTALRMARDLAAGAGATARSDVACRLAVAEAEALLLADALRSAEVALGLLEEAGADGERIAGFVVAVARPLKDASILAWSLGAGGPRELDIARLVERGLAALGDRKELTWARLKLVERPKARENARAHPRRPLAGVRSAGHCDRAREWRRGGLRQNAGLTGSAIPERGARAA